MKNDSKIKELVSVRNGGTALFLDENFRERTREETASFYAHAASDLAADMFAQLHLNVGPDVAERFLRDMLSLVVFRIRMKRIPVMPVIDVELHPVVEAAPEPNPDGECRCAVKDGRCLRCIAVLSAEYEAFARGMFTRLQVAGAKVEGFLSSTKACRTCFAPASDTAIAGLVPVFIPELVGQPELVPMIACGLLEVAMVGGLTESPHTKSALQARGA